MSEHPVDAHVGKRLRLRRNMLGMSQEELGTAVGVTFQQVQKYERGTNRIGSSRLFEIAKILSVPVGYFFDKFSPEEAIGEMGFAEKASEYEAYDMNNKETMNLVQAYYKIPDAAVRQKVLSLIKAMRTEKVSEDSEG